MRARLMRCQAVFQLTGVNMRRNFPRFMEVTQVIKFRRLRCSFCRKNETEVLKLVAGPRAYICDECVAIASRIMNGPDEDHQPPIASRPLWRRLLKGARRLLGGGAARRANSASVSG
jgi:hypothetical protein